MTRPIANRRNGLVGLGVLALFGVLLLWNTVAILLHPEGLRPVARGSGAPAFQLPLVGGGKVRGQDLVGTVTVLSFWATFCPPCLRELPILAKLQRALGPSGVRILAINVGDEPDQLAAFLDEMRTSGRNLDGLTLALDDGQAAARFGVRTLPHLVVMTRDGRVHAVAVGARSEAALRDLIEAALKVKP